MVGLPFETEGSIKDTIKLINSLNIRGIKIHSTYIIKNTILEELYLTGKYIPISLEDYIKKVTKIIGWLNKNIIVCRISGDAPKDLLVAPKWNVHKKIIINNINKMLEEKDIFQGDNVL